MCTALAEEVILDAQQNVIAMRVGVDTTMQILTSAGDRYLVETRLLIDVGPDQHQPDRWLILREEEVAGNAGSPDRGDFISLTWSDAKLLLSGLL
jgi:hypothetical protein